MKFGEELVHHHVSFIFGNGIFALRGVVLQRREDYLVVREEGRVGEQNIIHVPLSSVVYAKLGVKADV